MTLAEWMDRLWYAGQATTCNLEPAEARALLEAIKTGLVEVAERAAAGERKRVANALSHEGHPGSVLGRLAQGFDANGSEAE